MSEATDRVFAGSIPQIYERHLVPMIFAEYAKDIAQRAAASRLKRVLETAAGTGVVTRELNKILPREAMIVATDLNQAMIDLAAKVENSPRIEWRAADAMQLPFEDKSFDAVICQFGAMFFPDKAKAFAETRRVLRADGVFIFNVWDRIEENEFADLTTDALAKIFPSDPPRFLARTPHGYFQRETIERDLTKAGFAKVEIETLTKRSRAESAEFAAIGYSQGTPLRGEIEARDASRLQEATKAGAAAIARRFGSGPVDGKLQAHVVTARR